MKNYKFSLESVLEVRSNEEKDVLEDFVLAQNILIEEEVKKENIQKELNRCFKKRTFCKDVQTLMMENLYKNDLETKLKLQETIVEEKRIELEEVRERLQIAQKDKKIMEKLREKDLDDYKIEILKKNQKEIDDFAVLRYKQA